MTPVVVVAPHCLDRGDLQRRLHCSRATVERYLRRGLLPPPMFRLQRRVWDVAAIEAAEKRLHELHESSVSGAAGVGIARRAAARAAEGRALAELEAAAAAFLSHRSAGDLARVVQRFAPSGRLSDIPRDQRVAALRTLGGAK